MMKRPAFWIKHPVILWIAGCSFLTACNAPAGKQNIEKENVSEHWKQQLSEKLSFLGHRNWILVVDKAFPEQNAPGIEYIYVNEHLVPVLKQVIAQVHQSGHIKSIAYQDKELGFITEKQVKGIVQFRADVKRILGKQEVQTLLHDSVFKKLDKETRLFKVLVIKTNELIPYTSVFLQLDCAYWNSMKERELRTVMDLNQ